MIFIRIGVSENYYNFKSEWDEYSAHIFSAAGEMLANGYRKLIKMGRACTNHYGRQMVQSIEYDCICYFLGIVYW